MQNRNNRQVKSQVTKKAVQRQSANHPENSPGETRQAPFPCTQFESAVQRACALLDALAAKLQADNIDAINPRCPDFNSKLASTVIGYLRIIEDQQRELHKLYDDAFAWLQRSKKRPHTLESLAPER